MKYKAIKKHKNGTFSVADFSKGLDASHKSTVQISECENLWHKDGVLKTRPAFKVDEDHILPLGIVNIKKLTITDTVYYKDGIKYNIAYYSTGDGFGYEHIYVYIVSDKEHVEPLGRILNYRVDTQSFYSPSNVFFIVGAKTVGIGIYAFVTFVKLGAKKYQIFEAQDFDGEWMFISDARKYVPTLTLNGRGNCAQSAIETLGLDLGEVVSPERVNLINPKFKAYYTSDGFSWIFNLPQKNLDSETVYCTVYFNDDDCLEFEIPINGGDSKTYDGKTYSAFCDRVEGKVYFMSEGEACPIPQTFNFMKNNIIVTASKSVPDSEGKVIGSEGAAIFNSRAYLYGNKICPNEIYCCFLSNPLYFPKGAKTDVGSPEQRIVAAGFQNDKLIVFKEGEIYKVNTVSENSASKIFDKDAKNEFYISDTLTSQSISTKVGCVSKETLATDSGQLIWLGSDKKVYTLEATTYGSEKNIFELSEKIDGILKEKINFQNPVFAFAKDGYYYLLNDGTLFVCNCHITNMGHARRYGALNRESVSWYEWKLPHKNITSAKSCGEIILAATDSFKRVQSFIYLCDENKDTEATNIFDDAFETKEYPIKVKFMSGSFPVCDFEKIRIKKAVLDAERESPSYIKLQTDKDIFKRHIHNSKGEISICPDIYAKPTRRVSFSFESEGKATFLGLKFYFKEV